MEWLDYKEAAALMHRPARYLRQRDAAGGFLFFPDIERWQPGGPRTQVLVRREHVEAWIERSRTPVAVKQEFNGTGYQSLVPYLRQNGADRVIRSLGLKDFRQSAET